MTTSDDEPIYAEQDGDLAGTTHADPLAAPPGDGDGVDGAVAAPLAGQRGGAGRVLLGVLAALVAAVAGIALWAFVYVQFEREYVGVSVVIGLAVGWLIRVVSRRSDIWLRLLAMVITAVASIVGTIAGEVAYTADSYQADFWQLFGDVLPDWYDLLRRRPAMTFAIFAAGVILAYLAASPQKEKKPAAAAPAAGAGYASDEELPPGEYATPAGDDDPDDDPDDDRDEPRLPPA